ncbi:hypothetical protein LG314_07915 [Agrococcus terreus]|uniref:hypothetical protein n=1 Tax=Agrococcus terreus TaxID=574649 RepID=UPI00384A9A11
MSIPYTPDARLMRGSTVVDWLDAVADFEDTSDSASTVQTTLNATGPRHHVVVRPAGPVTGRLVLHFAHELSTVTPGARAEAVASSLRLGVPHHFEALSGHPGLSSFDFVPTGAVVRRLERETSHLRTRTVWTVEVDYTRTAAS